MSCAACLYRMLAGAYAGLVFGAPCTLDIMLYAYDGLLPPGSFHHFFTGCGVTALAGAVLAGLFSPRLQSLSSPRRVTYLGFVVGAAWLTLHGRVLLSDAIVESVLMVVAGGAAGAIAAKMSYAVVAERVVRLTIEGGRALRYSIRGLLVATTVLCALCALVAAPLHSVRQLYRARHLAEESLREQGAEVWWCQHGGRDLRGSEVVVINARSFGDNNLLALSRHLVALSAESIRLSDTNVSDVGALRLLDIRTLRRIELDGTRVGDASVRLLCRLPNLETLTLARTAVSDEGVADMQCGPALRYLDCRQTRVSDMCIARLRLSCPCLHIAK